MGDANTLFVGLHIEKGFGSETGSAANSKKERPWVMDESWIWHSALEDLKSGEFNSCCGRMQSAIGAPVVVRVHSALWQPEDFAPYSNDDQKKDRVEFEYSDGDLVKVSAKTTMPYHLLGNVANSDSFESLAESIVEMKDATWIRVEMMIGLHFDLDRTASRPENYTMERLWADVLMQAIRWFR